MNKLLIKSSLATAIALTIAACTPADNEGLAGIGGSGYVSSGSVSGFGSVFVNGVEFETDSAMFDVDGASGTQDDLGIGMVVQVSGTINDDGVTGTATAISYNNELQGPVTAAPVYDADLLTAAFTVLGINVIIDSSSTTFVGTIFDTVNKDNNIEISGFFDSAGNLKATRVELKDAVFAPDTSIVEIKGTIATLSGNTFSLDGTSLSVDASSANLNDLPNGLQEGLFVEVKGTLDAGRTTLAASDVNAEDLSIPDTDEFELEGIITDYNGYSNFKIKGISIDASSAEFEPASLQLDDDVLIEAEGAVVNGILIADKIESEGGDIKVHATVSSVNTDSNSFTLQPVLTPPQEITVTVTTNTQIEDDVDEDKYFTLNNLVIGDFVEARGYENSSGGMTAVEIDVREASKVIVQGYASAVEGDASGGSITVFGVTFSFNSSTEFEDDADEALKGPGITDLITDIKDSSTAPRLIKIEDKDEGGGPDGIADEIDIESH